MLKSLIGFFSLNKAFIIIIINIIPDTPVLASAEPAVSPDLISTVGVAARPVETYSLGLVSETSVSPVDSCRGLVVSLNLSEGDASCRPPGSVSLMVWRAVRAPALAPASFILFRLLSLSRERPLAPLP